jgi:hypothetical protein
VCMCVYVSVCVCELCESVCVCVCVCVFEVLLEVLLEMIVLCHSKPHTTFI